MKLLKALWLPLGLMLISVCLCIIHYVFIIAVWFFYRDMKSRYIEYKFYVNRPPFKRYMRLMKGSWCQRNVMIAIHPESKKYYYELGYRWFTMFPDYLVENPMAFFKPSNIKRTFFK